jgi:SNF2 family DNA or RNA helicase
MLSLILHGTWTGDSFFLWGESATPAARRGRKPRLLPHPHAAPVEELGTALAGLTGLDDGTPTARTLLLPSGRAGPRLPPWLVPGREEDPDPPHLAPWKVPGLALEILPALDLLVTLPAEARGERLLGADLRYWGLAAKFGIELLARQRYLPGLAAVEGGYRAVWLPTLEAPAERARRRALVQSMPPVCRAAFPAGTEPTPEQAAAPVALLDSFLGRLVDQAVRDWGRTRPGRRARSPEGVAAAWWTALWSEDATIAVPAGQRRELAQLYEAWREWHDQLRTAGEAAFRLCFRLEPPQVDPETGQVTTPDWMVRYMLQASDDPSLLVPAEQVWKARGGALDYFQRRFEQPQEKLLAGLGQAARLFPPILASLRTARPQGCSLAVDEAYAFLREVGPLLEGSGFGVLVPPWWNKPGARLGLRAKTKADTTVGKGLLGLNSLVEFDWELALGDATLTEEEFQRLAALKMPLVQVRGQWVFLPPDQVEAAIAFWEKKRRQQQALTLGDALGLALGTTTAVAGLPVQGVEATGWLQELLQQLQAGDRLQELPPPEGFVGQLRPYQVRGYSWLAFLRKWGLGACLADSMGLGKCLRSDALVATNGVIQQIQDIWDASAGEAWFDGEGYWATPTRPLLVNALDEQTGRMVQAPVQRLYRQHVRERLRQVTLEDGSSIAITYPHHLLAGAGWTNDLHVGDYVCVPARIVWEGQAEDPDLVKFLAWQIAEGYDYEQSIPPFLMQADLDTVRLFLRHYFDAKGSAVRRMRSIEISTASPILIRQLAQLLRRFGIWLRVAAKRKRATNGAGIYRTYYSGVLGGNAARKFLQEIGFGQEEKQKRLEEIWPEANTNVEGLLDQEVFYCRIESIEEVDYDGWVYDLQVEGHHNFVAENILCHNTIQAISLLLHEREHASLPPALVLCPTSVVGNWEREVHRFAPSLRVLVHHGTGRASGEDLVAAAQSADLVISTYGLARRDVEDLARIEWSDVILDEAQNIKNPQAKQTQAVRTLPAANRIALTGTPVENRLSELWSIMHFLNPGFLGSQAQFRERYALRIERYQDEDAARGLRRLVAPFILRRLKTDPTIIQDLPEKQEIKVYCSLTPEQVTLYEAVVQDSLERINSADEGITRKGVVLSALLKLKQVCNHPAHFLGDGSALPERSGKLDRLGEMLEEALSVGDRALIFTQFAEMGHLLRAYLQELFGVEVLYLHGGTPQKQRDRIVDRFQQPQGGPPLLLLSIKAGGTGLNLTNANHVFHYDRWWNPAVEDQATDRAFRIGQTRNVLVHKFICAGTLEEHIDELIESKKALAESIVGAGESWLTELSTDQLRDLMVLRQE